ncbi:MAG: hypothetical protein HZB61_12405 [Nitrospirae bacterium]|nr:hypothetical protein [Nitrospirota bacterium]
MRKQLLFVTYENEDFDEGLSYAVDLARAMKEDLTILMARKKSLARRLEDIMSAVTFAESGEHETARKIFSDKMDAVSRVKLNQFLEQCQNEGIVTRVYTVALDAISAIKDFLKEKNTVDMVLLSPSVTDNGSITSSDLQKLVRTASRPIVTMARQIYAA